MLPAPAKRARRPDRTRATHAQNASEAGRQRHAEAGRADPLQTTRPGLDLFLEVNRQLNLKAPMIAELKFATQ